MALQRISFSILGEDQYSRAFEAYASEVEDMREPFADIGESVRLSVSEQFRTEGMHGSGRHWSALNPDYARWKRQAVGEQPILVFTGDMRAEMTSRSAVHVTSKRMIYAPRDEKAKWHQVGEGNVPARPMVAINMAERRGFDRTFAEWLNGLRHGPLGV